MTPKFKTLLSNLDGRGLTKMQARLPAYIDEINEQQLSFTEALLHLTEDELAWQDQCQINRIIKRARFPQSKSLSAFNFEFQPSINQQEILGFQYLSFLEQQENLIFTGSPRCW